MKLVVFLLVLILSVGTISQGAGYVGSFIVAGTFFLQRGKIKLNPLARFFLVIIIYSMCVSYWSI
ncbi:hypothetical protein, partial [Chromohalobacter sp. 48-RD10]|uniref:hypothetical protein n=1 Tax=Chromohalobacter sp. 48-RD10 TaxID=2994063 RepID=UPI002468E67E